MGLKKVLVTGGSGFIGSILCEQLLMLGYRVVNVDNFDAYYSPQIKWRNITKARQDTNYELVTADLRDQAELDRLFGTENFDCVVHLAALAGVRNSIEKPIEYAEVDIMGTIRVLEACVRYGVQKLVFASSSSVYGNHAIPFREDAVIRGQLSPYAVAKYSAEQYCSVYHTLYKLPIVCLRFFTVYGERQRPEMAIHKLTRQIDKGEQLQLFGAGSSSRDYTYVRDLVRGIISSIELSCGYEVINLGSGRQITLATLVQLIGEGLGKQPDFKYGQQQGEIAHTLADIDKARQLLGYHPETSFEHGLGNFLAWYKRHQ